MYSHGLSLVHVDAQEEARVRLKMDLRLIPLVSLVYREYATCMRLVVDAI